MSKGLDFDVTPAQAGAGYEVLRQHEADSYLAMTWLPQVERRYQQGDAIETLMATVLRAAYAWYRKATAADYPTGTDQHMCLQLFGAMDVEAPPPTNTLSHGGWGTGEG